MLESLVASLLNRFLGSYVSNLNYDQLNIGIWNGMKLSEEETPLKRNALTQHLGFDRRGTPSRSKA